MIKKLLIIPILTLPFSSTVFAEDPGESTLTLDTMAVTAEVLDAKLGGIDIKTLPVASTIVNQEEMKRLKFVDPDELLDRIPGETQVRNLRIPNGSKSYTIPMVDGAALTSPLSGSTQAFGDSVNAQDIERIEIFKGPVSALHANNAFGGVINVVSKGSVSMPEQNTRFWVEAGNHDRYRGGVSSQGELKGVGYLFDLNTWNIGAYRDQTNITDNLGNTTIQETGEERHQASAKFIFHPDEVSSLILRGSYLKEHLTVPGDLEEPDFIIDDSGIGKDGTFSDEETFTGSAIYKRDFTDADHLDANFTIRLLESSGISRFSGSHDDDTTDINGKISYKHDFDFWNSNFIMGTDIYHGINDDFNPGKMGRSGMEESSKDYGTTGIYAGFAQVQFSPIENLQITAGVRHESIDLEQSNTTQSGVVTANRASFSATLPKAGISYDFLDRHRVWFAYGEGFLAPSISQLYTGRGNNPNLNPEEAEHFEVGLRGSLPLFNRDLTYDTSYYHQDINQYIINRDLLGVDMNANAGKVTIQGVETVLEYQPFDFIRLGVTHTYARNIYKRYIDSNGDDLSGEEMNRSPEHHINGRVAVMPLEGLAIELEVDSSTSYTTLDNASKDPQGRFSRDERINLRLTYDKGPYELWFHALNIGDVKEDRVGYSTRSGVRSIRTVDGLQLYGGIAYNF
ncbi:MAG: TonB-dependent receptor [Methylococcales bacterium]|nr:TonB-dependent receptor [Methylococcales bacterium]